jgi:hypothetical protein
MGTPKPPSPVRLIIGMLAANKELAYEAKAIFNINPER